MCPVAQATPLPATVSANVARQPPWTIPAEFRDWGVMTSSPYRFIL